MKKFYTLAGAFVTFLVFMLACLVLEGVTLYYLWYWFITPLGVPAIGFYNALGVGVIVHFLTYHYYDFKKNDVPGIADPMCYLFVRPALTLLVGWIIHLMM